MVSTRNILLAAASVSAVSGQNANIYRTDMSESSFKTFPAATAYKGSKIKFDYYTAANADADLNFMHLVKPVVMRFKGQGIDFEPHMLVARGEADFVGCRAEDGSEPANSPHGCDFHCTNGHRYCDGASFDGNAINARHHRGIHGGTYVKESARLTCIWDKYGAKTESGVYRFFQYMDALKGTGCEKSYSPACLEQVMQTVDFDYEEVEKCAGDVSGPDKNEVLEKIVRSDSPVSYVPAIVIDGNEDTSFERYVEHHKGQHHESVLATLCRTMGDNKPPVCDFCLNYCPDKVGDAYDMNTCLWELKCGDKNTGFDDYRKGFGVAAPEGVADGEKQEPNTFSNSSSKSYSKTASEGLGVVATFMAVILAAGFAALAVMAIRVWRTKMIIDRYVKEQQAMNDAQQNGGGLGHRDPIYFPDDSALDLDLEPALQYSDHIGGVNGRASPPHAASFLPQLT
jgi:hypothetical protein